MIDFDDIDLETMENEELDQCHLDIQKEIERLQIEVDNLEQRSLFVSGEQASYEIDNMIENNNETICELRGKMDSIMDILKERCA